MQHPVCILAKLYLIIPSAVLDYNAYTTAYFDKINEYTHYST